jgi:hypothetical protein
MLVIGLAVAPAQATIILSDNFSNTTGNVPATPGAQPDTAKWNPTLPAALGGSTVNGTLDGAGNVLIPSTPNASAIVAHTSFSAAPTVAAPLRLTVDLTSFANSGIFGLDDFAGSADSLQLRDDQPTSTWQLFVVNDNAITAYNTGIAINTTPASTGVWVIDWTPSKVTVSLNSVQLIDTSVTTPIFGSGVLPNAAIRPFAFNYNGSGSVDLITFESIPEPASLLALSAAAILIVRRHRKC